MSTLGYHVGTDILAGADLLRDALEDTIPCAVCGSKEPARLGRDMDGTYGCSDCRDYRHCHLCQRFTFEEEGRFAHGVDFGDGKLRSVCEVCYERKDPGIESPLDYREDAP